ncbi:MAG: rRNA maturation RNase YbeY [Planctomycetota bacterium]
MAKRQIEISDMSEREICAQPLLNEMVDLVLDEEGAPEFVDLSLAVVDEEETRRVNREFLGREGTTDVISFPYECSDERLCGEVVVNADEALRQAERTGHAPAEELMLYVVHGVLHLLGYTDYTPEHRNRMNRKALKVLEKDGYTLNEKTLLEEI